MDLIDKMSMSLIDDDTTPATTVTPAITVRQRDAGGPKKKETPTIAEAPVLWQEELKKACTNDYHSFVDVVQRKRRKMQHCYEEIQGTTINLKLPAECTFLGAVELSRRSEDRSILAEDKANKLTSEIKKCTVKIDQLLNEKSELSGKLNVAQKKVESTTQENERWSL